MQSMPSSLVISAILCDGLLLNSYMYQIFFAFYLWIACKIKAMIWLTLLFEALWYLYLFCLTAKRYRQYITHFGITVSPRVEGAYTTPLYDPLSFMEKMACFMVSTLFIYKIDRFIKLLEHYNTILRRKQIKATNRYQI